MNHCIIFDCFTENVLYDQPLHQMTSFGTVRLIKLCQANHNLVSLEIKYTVRPREEAIILSKKHNRFNLRELTPGDLIATQVCEDFSQGGEE